MDTSIFKFGELPEFKKFTPENIRKEFPYILEKIHKDFENIANLILFDSNGMEKSKTIPKKLLSELPKGEKFGLAGAINLENIQEYCQLGFSFLDLSSGLERENLKGYKDHLKIKNFINKVNELKNKQKYTSN